MLTHFINSLVYTFSGAVRYFKDNTKISNWIQFVQYCIQRHTDDEYSNKIGEEFAQIISNIKNATLDSAIGKTIEFD